MPNLENNPIIIILMMLFGNPFGIGLIIFLLVFLFKKIFRKKESNQPEEQESNQPEEPPQKTANYNGPAYIFINGGAPTYGDVMGKVTVDGKSLDLLYSEAPIQIAITAGMRNVVIEGGLVGDACIDRVIEFTAYDVLTVDMPGEGDQDVIRHQMIRYSEYSKALSQCGYRPTRKEL